MSVPLYPEAEAGGGGIVATIGTTRSIELHSNIHASGVT